MVKKSGHQDKRRLNKNKNEDEDDSSSIIGYFFLVALIIFSTITSIYFLKGIEVSWDYRSINFRSYDVVQNLNSRDEFLSLLEGELRQQEKKMATNDVEEFVPSPLLQELINSREAYIEQKSSTYLEFNKVNRHYLESMVKYLNYVAKKNPEMMNDTQKLHVSYIIEYNNALISAMEEQNHSIIEYKAKFEDRFYAFVARFDKDYALYEQVVTYDTADYLEGISSVWYP